MSIEANIHIRALICLLVAALAVGSVQRDVKKKKAIQSILYLKSVGLVLQCVKQIIKGNFSLWAKTWVRTSCVVCSQHVTFCSSSSTLSESSQSQTVVSIRKERPPWRPHALLVLLTRLRVFRLGQQNFTGYKTHTVQPRPLYDGGSAHSRALDQLLSSRSSLGRNLYCCCLICASFFLASSSSLSFLSISSWAAMI